jgi:tetratricopeptide (TPR) repeat protein
MQRSQLIYCALLIAHAAAANAKEIWEGRWIEIRSEHFVLASALSEERSTRLALELENFRAAVDVLTGAKGIEDAIPTKIYLLPRAEEALGFGGSLDGYFSAQMRANYAVMIASGSYSDEVLKHEYTHYLIANRDLRQFPPWLNEGLAEVFSTLRVAGSAVEFGRGVEGRLNNLMTENWISFESVLDRRPGSRMGGRVTAMFYAQSWMLVHYLMVGGGRAEFPANVADYMRRLEGREPALPAFEAAFGLEVGPLEHQLIDYSRRMGYYRFTLKTPFSEAALRTREMPIDEVAAEVGLLASMRGNHDDARAMYEAALAANPDNADALVGLADLHKFAHRYDEAAPLYERALALEPNDAEHLLDYGEYFLDRARAEPAADARRELLVEARRRFARSYRLDPDNPETLSQNGVTYLFGGEDVDKALESLEEAHAILPSQPEIQIMLAQAYIAARDTEHARDLLEGLLAASHEERAEQLEKLLAALPPASAQDASDEDADK